MKATKKDMRTLLLEGGPEAVRAATEDAQPVDAEQGETPSVVLHPAREGADKSESTTSAKPLADGTEALGETGDRIDQLIQNHIGDCFYDRSARKFLVKNQRGQWIGLGDAGIRRWMRTKGIDNKVRDDEPVSDCDAAMVQVQDQRDIDFAGELAGWRAGFHNMNGSRILVTRSPHLSVLPEPDDHEHRIVLTLIEELLGDQTKHFLGWLQRSVKCIRDARSAPGQAVAFAGEAGTGKSLLQALITECLGGRSAKAYLFLTGRTDFNADLFGAEHLMIEDEASSKDMRSRKRFAEHLKGVVANRVHACHKKQCDIVNLEPFWRLTISTNDDPEDLMVLPPLDRGVVDKLMLMRVSPTLRDDGYFEHETIEAREEWSDRFFGAVPAFLSWLLSRFILPEELTDQRYGVKTYHHPELVEALESLSNRAHLLDLIDRELWTREGLLDGEGCWSGSSTDLHAILTDRESAVCHDARKLLYFPNATGTFLGQLAKKKEGRVASVRSSAARRWRISPPGKGD